MQIFVDVVYINIFSYISITRDLIDCDSFLDYESIANCVYLVIQKVADKIMIDLNAEEFPACVNAIEELAI